MSVSVSLPLLQLTTTQAAASLAAKPQAVDFNSYLKGFTDSLTGELSTDVMAENSGTGEWMLAGVAAVHGRLLPAAHAPTVQPGGQSLPPVPALPLALQAQVQAAVRQAAALNTAQSTTAAAGPQQVSSAPEPVVAAGFQFKTSKLADAVHRLRESHWPGAQPGPSAQLNPGAAVAASVAPANKSTSVQLEPARSVPSTVQSGISLPTKLQERLEQLGQQAFQKIPAVDSPSASLAVGSRMSASQGDGFTAAIRAQTGSHNAPLLPGVTERPANRQTSEAGPGLRPAYQGNDYGQETALAFRPSVRPEFTRVDRDAVALQTAAVQSQSSSIITQSQPVLPVPGPEQQQQLVQQLAHRLLSPVEQEMKAAFEKPQPGRANISGTQVNTGAGVIKPAVEGTEPAAFVRQPEGWASRARQAHSVPVPAAPPSTAGLRSALIDADSVGSKLTPQTLNPDQLVERNYSSLDRLAQLDAPLIVTDKASTRDTAAVQVPTAAPLNLVSSAAATAAGSSQALNPVAVAEQTAQMAQAVQNLGQRIQWMLSTSSRQIDIRLDPPELGSLQIQVNSSDERQASVAFLTQNPAARELIEAHLPRLREHMESMGLELGDTSVEQQTGGQADESQNDRLAAAGRDESSAIDDDQREQRGVADDGDAGGIDAYA